MKPPTPPPISPSPLLILRPEPGASQTAHAARLLGLVPLCHPLFVVEPLAWAAPCPLDHSYGAYDAVMMTSANAARYGGVGLGAYTHLPLYAVGQATAEAARRHGWTVVHHGQGNGANLLLAMEKAGVRHALHLTGRERTTMPPCAFRLDVVPVYATRTLPVTGLPTEAVALLHSTRAAQRFAGLVAAKTRRNFTLVGISEAVIAAAGPGWRRAIAAPRPDDATMLALAAKLCHMNGPDA